MPAILPGYEYDIFISYRQKDNKYDGWVTAFVQNLKKDLEATFKEDISVYFDENPHDGLLETHDVDASLKNKLKCLIFIPIISQTYCDPKSFAWQHEFLAFKQLAENDGLGLKKKLDSGNVSSRILPVRIHDLDNNDITLVEEVLGGRMRSVDFVYKEPGVNRSLRPEDDEAKNLNKTNYRNQVNKVANAVKEIVSAMKSHAVGDGQQRPEGGGRKSDTVKRNPGFKIAAFGIVAAFILLSAGYYFYQQQSNNNQKPIDKSVAVLPFVNLSGDTEQDYFADGLSDEIINALTQLNDLKVIARTSSFQFKGKNEDLRVIGEKLGVAHILEGSVRRGQNTIRVIAQLIDVRDGSHLWSKTFDKTPADIIIVQEEIARNVADQLKSTLHLSMRSTPWNETALNLYQEGRFFYDRNGAGDRKHSHELFLKALQFDSTKAIIYAHLAGYTAEVGREYAKKYADRALQLDSTLGEAHAVMSRIFRDEQNYHESEKEISKGLKYGPSSPLVLRVAGRFYCLIGHTEEAMRFARKAVDLDPLLPLSHQQLGWCAFDAGLYRESVAEFRKALELNPNIEAAHSEIAKALLMDGAIQDASAEIQLEKGTPRRSFAEAAITFAMGNKEKAESLYRNFALAQGDNPDPAQMNAYDVAELASYMGKNEESIKYLRKARALKSWNLAWLKHDPFLKGIRNDPGYQAILKELNFPD